VNRFTLILATILLMATSIGADAATSMVRMADRTPVDVRSFVDEVGGADVVFLGDTHDDNNLHKNQLEIIQALYAKTPKLAIALEMFTADNQRYLDYWSNGQLTERDFADFYAKNWSYDWRLYRDIFIFVRDKQIPMVALNMPKSVAAKVVRQGAQGLNEGDKTYLPPGGPWPLNPRQAEYLRRIRSQVFGNPASPIATRNFDDAQALRNQTMAYHLAEFRKANPGRKVVVIAGSWHAIKNGVPASLKDYGTSSSKVVLPDLVEFKWLKPTTDDIDYLIPRGE
jgi:uncharacterized iron-regulated protein